MSKNVSVIGSGSWGTALAILLSKNGHNVTMWSWQREEAERLSAQRENKEFLPGVLIPDNIICTNNLEDASSNKDAIILAVPSHAVRQNARSLNNYLKKGQVLINVAKGLEMDTHLTMGDVILQEIANVNLCILSGPTHAEEVAKDIPTTIVAAAQENSVAEYVQDLFMNDNFRVYTNLDVKGVEIGGSIKNVIALCAGISDGLGFGDNTKAALMTRGLTEMTRLGVNMGADIQTFAGLTGIGDLIVTCTSMHSRNRRAGILIGKGYSLDQAIKEVHMVVEGVNTAKAAYELAQKYSIEMPITEQAYKILFEGKDARKAVMSLMARGKTHENNI